MARSDQESETMEYRVLGQSGLKLSTLGFGTANFGDTEGNLGTWGRVQVDSARRMFDICLEAGVNWIDTADAYSAGTSEDVVGHALEGGRRQRVILATKARFPMGNGPNDAGLSRRHLIESCEASLRRLKTDYIDLYQMHQWDGVTPLEETMRALEDLVRSGKVRYVGCSNFSAWHIMKALAVAERERSVRFVSQQILYTLQAREAEYELVPLAVDQGVGILVWSPLAGGWLSGKYRRGRPMPEGSRFAQKFKEPIIYDYEKLYDTIEVLATIAEERNVSGAQVAIAWVLGRPAVVSVVLGARTEAQLVDTLGGADLKLTAEEIARLDEISAPNLIYPYWHQAMLAKDRLSPADLTLLAPYLGKDLTR
jgi:aryl-alcohol dehydrogenase-like predicted oxidoreductase